jgi:hypothetical protein
MPVWYALKTVIRQGAKFLPKNAALATVFASFGHEEKQAETETPQADEDTAPQSFDSNDDPQSSLGINDKRPSPPDALAQP